MEKSKLDEYIGMIEKMYGAKLLNCQKDIIRRWLEVGAPTTNIHICHHHGYTQVMELLIITRLIFGSAR